MIDENEEESHLDEKKYFFKFKNEKFQQLFWFYPTYNETFLIRSYEKIIHVTKVGKRIRQFSFPTKNFHSMFLVTDWMAIIVVTCIREKKTIIYQWNILGSSVKTIQIDNLLGLQTFYFGETKCLCLLFQEEKDYVIQKIEFLILEGEMQRTSFVKEKIKKIFPKSILKWKKLNHHSGIYCIESEIIKCERKIYKGDDFIHIFNISDPNKDMITCKLNMPVVTRELTDYYEAHVEDVWEPINGQIYIRFERKVNFPKFYQKHFGKLNLGLHIISQEICKHERYFQYFWDYIEDKWRVPPFFQYSKRRRVVQFSSDLRKVDRLKYSEEDRIKQIKLSLNLFINSQKRLEDFTKYPVVVDYVDLLTERTVVSQRAKEDSIQDCYIWKNCETFPEYSFTRYMESNLNNRIKKDGFIQYTFIGKLREFDTFFLNVSSVTVFFLLELCDNFDDDLVFNVLSLVRQEELGFIQKNIQ